MRWVSALLCGLTLLGASTNVFAKEVELRNDTLQDKQQAAAVCGFNIGEKFAALLTPPAYPATLRKVQVLVTHVGLSLSSCSDVPVATDIEMPLEIFYFKSSVPGTSLGEITGLAFSNDNVLNEIDVSASNFKINDGAFLVALTLKSTNGSPVHDKSGNAIPESNFIFGDTGSGAKWMSFKDLGAAAPKGNWVVRAIASVPDSPEAGAGGSSPDAGTDAAGAPAQPAPPPAESSGCGMAKNHSESWGALAALGLCVVMRSRRRQRGTS